MEEGQFTLTEYREALQRFRVLLDKAKRLDLKEPTAMILATADEKGRPAARTVLLKSFDERGFVFYTSQESRKGEHIAANPWAALCIYWDPLRSQAIVEGRVEPVAPEQSDAYWATRSRQSQIGAWASLQSRPLKSRAALLARVAKYEARFLGRRILRPAWWLGFRIVPERIEFWAVKPYRLHERVLYEKKKHGWTVRNLYP